jgi:prefoldin subunit 5
VRIEDEAVLEKLKFVVPLLREMMQVDIAVGLFDTEKCLAYQPAKSFDQKARPGDTVKPGSGTYQAITEKKRIVKKIDASVYGVPYVVVALPIKNDLGEIIGVMAVSQSVEQQEALTALAGSLSDAVSSLAGTSEEISAQTEEIAANLRQMTQTAVAAQKRVAEMDQVLGLIKTIAGQTNLLGLNAAIEAARVGEQGRGFGVVAEEIRKLAHMSTDSIKKIDSMVRSIQTDSEETHRHVAHVDEVINQVASAITQVTEAVQHASETAQKLDQMARRMSGDDY